MDRTTLTRAAAILHRLYVSALVVAFVAGFFSTLAIQLTVVHDSLVTVSPRWVDDSFAENAYLWFFGAPIGCMAPAVLLWLANRWIRWIISAPPQKSTTVVNNS